VTSVPLIMMMMIMVVDVVVLVVLEVELAVGVVVLVPSVAAASLYCDSVICLSFVLNTSPVTEHVAQPHAGPSKCKMYADLTIRPFPSFYCVVLQTKKKTF
jgi:hypothetical protein